MAPSPSAFVHLFYDNYDNHLNNQRPPLLLLLLVILLFLLNPPYTVLLFSRDYAWGTPSLVATAAAIIAQSWR